MKILSTYKSLLLLWQNPDTTLYYHIGTLSFDGEKYCFYYTHHNDVYLKVSDALRNGYIQHPAFRDLDKTYESLKMFDAFNRRIPSEHRENFIEILDDLGLDSSADRMDILKATRGKLLGDSYSFEEPLMLSDDQHLTSTFYINGMRHRNLPSSWSKDIAVNEDVVLEPEYNNDKDSNAVKIMSKGGIHLGYVPGVYAEAVNALIQTKLEPTIKIKQIRPTSTPQWWLQVRFECFIPTVNDDFVNSNYLRGLFINVA